MFDVLSLFGSEPAPPRPAQAAANADDSLIDPGDFAGYPFELIRSPRQLIHALRQAAQAKLPVTLISSRLGIGCPSRLVDVDPARSELSIRQLIDDRAHDMLVADRRFNLLLRHEESSILLSLTLSDAGGRQGCYVAPLPAWAVSSQMRSWRRIHVSGKTPLTLNQRFADLDSLEARVVDISESGLGLVVPHLPLRGIRPHERWSKARLDFSRTRIGPLDLEVRHIHCEQGRQRIGLAIRQASEGQCQHLRRLLLQLQSGHH